MKILIFPKGDNPYQELLYRELRRGHANDKYSYYPLTALRLLFLPLLAFAYRLQGYTMFHVHWPAFAINRPIPGIKYISFAHAFICLMSLRVLGYKIIWTVHNVVPHSVETANDLAVARFLARIASAKIVHSPSTISEMSSKRLDTSRTVIIPHGNYVGWYKQGVTRTQARQKFSIPKEAFVVAFVGRIEPYKNVPELLRACKALAAEYPIYLLVGGKANSQFADELLKSSSDADTIRLELRFINDDELQYFFASADVAAYPFTEITTSGSALLALSFGVPIIAPRIGALADIPQSAGFFYNPPTESLQAMLKSAILQPEKLAAARMAACEYRDTLNWEDIAHQTYRLYDKLAKNGRI